MAKANTRWGRHRRFYVYACDYCGKRFERNGQLHGRAKARKKASKRNLDFCCKPCKDKYRTGANHPSWKNGESISNGYVYISVPKGTPGAYVCKRTGRHKKLKHIMVMEKNLGRLLRKSEEVHHKNGIRNDNRIENLELRCSPHGSGATSYTEDVNRLLAENERLRALANSPKEDPDWQI